MHHGELVQALALAAVNGENECLEHSGNYRHVRSLSDRCRLGSVLEREEHNV